MRTEKDGDIERTLSLSLSLCVSFSLGLGLSSSSLSGLAGLHLARSPREPRVLVLSRHLPRIRSTFPYAESLPDPSSTKFQTEREGSEREGERRESRRSSRTELRLVSRRRRRKGTWRRF